MDMNWGHAEGIEKAHCFKEYGKLDLMVSLCSNVFVFKFNPIEEDPLDQVKFCFGCLLGFIDEGRVKK